MSSDELAVVIELLRASPVFGGDFAASRDSLEAGASAMPLPDGVDVEAVDAAGVSCEWVRSPGARDERTIMYLHGGGYTIGSLLTHRRLVANLCEHAGARGLSVGYRLAPEHPFPAAVEDSVAAYRWLLQQGADPERIVIAGDSAGGGLAAATLVALRDEGVALPCGGALISPWTDLTMTAETYDTRAQCDPMIERESLSLSALAYLGRTDPKTPLASPLFADLSGLPPLAVHVGDFECLLDDSREFCARAEDAGVEVELWVAPEMIHVWHAFAGLVPESDAAVARLGQWIRRRLD